MTVGPISEEFAKRQDEKPDQWTLAWWWKRYAELQEECRGQQHAANRVLAANEELEKSVIALRKQCEEMRIQRAEDRAKIGELQALVKSTDDRLTAMDGRISRMAEFLTELKKERGDVDAA